MECGDYPGGKHDGSDCSRAVIRRVQAVMLRCNNARAYAVAVGDKLQACAYDDAAEWIRRALAGDDR